MRYIVMMLALIRSHQLEKYKTIYYILPNAVFLSLGCTLESPEKLSTNINTYTSPLEIVVENGSQASVFFLVPQVIFMCLKG